MEEKTRKQLEEHFPRNQIKQRDGGFGKKLDYLATATVVQRLNDVLKSDWSFEVVEHIRDEYEIAVLVKLTVGDIVKMQWGSASIKCKKNSTKIISLGDDYKSATSDALKKAATLLGCGLHLYQDSPQNTPKSPNRSKLPPNRGDNIPPTIQIPEGKIKPNVGKSDSKISDAKKECMLAAKMRGLLADDITRKAFTSTITDMYKLKKGERLSVKQWNEVSIKLGNDKFVTEIMDTAEELYDEKGGK